MKVEDASVVTTRDFRSAPPKDTGTRPTILLLSIRLSAVVVTTHEQMKRHQERNALASEDLERTFQGESELIEESSLAERNTLDAKHDQELANVRTSLEST